MANIRYVCLSDLHLGEEDSLLTNTTAEGEIDTAEPSPTLLRLTDCILELLRHNEPGAPKPTLILNGDILELALSRMDKALLVFEQLLSHLMPPGEQQFAETIFLPGNHDHHLWETARETQYLNYISQPGVEVEEPWHTTKVFMDMQGSDRLVSNFLTGVARRLPHLKDVEILTGYPNYGILKSGEDGNRCVVFHHGHFVEAIYSAMSKATSLVFSDYEMPSDVYKLEEDNFAWIDFFWSTMGRAGEVGGNIERIYEATADRHTLNKITNQLARNIAHEFDIPYLWPDYFERLALQSVFRGLVVNNIGGTQERQQAARSVPEAALSAKGERGLHAYVEGPLRKQIEVEHGSLPESVTFVFGHTHKPFERMMNFAGYRQDVPVLNSGGWIVESVETAPLRGGSIIVVDEDLTAVSVRMYTEGNHRPRVEEPGPQAAEPSPLRKHVKHILDTEQKPWSRFEGAVDEGLAKRAKLRAARLGLLGA